MPVPARLLIPPLRCAGTRNELHFWLSHSHSLLEVGGLVSPQAYISSQKSDFYMVYNQIKSVKLVFYE